jgi:hypothetical protein
MASEHTQPESGQVYKLHHWKYLLKRIAVQCALLRDQLHQHHHFHQLYQLHQMVVLKRMQEEGVKQQPRTRGRNRIPVPLMLRAIFRGWPSSTRGVRFTLRLSIFSVVPGTGLFGRTAACFEAKGGGVVVDSIRTTQCHNPMTEFTDDTAMRLITLTDTSMGSWESGHASGGNRVQEGLTQVSHTILPKK